MPAAFKSKAQMERCRRLVAEGKVTQESFDASVALTDLEALPERIHPKTTEKVTEKAEAES